MASLSDGGVLLCLLPPSPGLETRNHGEGWGGQWYCPTRGEAYMNVVLVLGDTTVLRKRGSLSHMVGWCVLHRLTGHQWGTHLSSLGLQVDEETWAMIEQVATLYEAASPGGSDPKHILSTGKSQREGSDTLMLEFSRPAVSPGPSQYWAVLGIIVLCPLRCRLRLQLRINM